MDTEVNVKKHREKWCQKTGMEWIIFFWDEWERKNGTLRGLFDVMKCCQKLISIINSDQMNICVHIGGWKNHNFRLLGMLLGRRE